MIVTDASPVIALFRAEAGGENLVQRLAGAVISAVNYSEVIARMVELDIDPTIWRPGLAALRMEIVPFDAGQAERAALLKRTTRHLGVSLGDRACLSLGLDRQTTVLTADRRWTELDLGIPIELIR